MAAFEWVLGVLGVIVWVAGMIVFFREGVGASLPFMAGRHRDPDPRHGRAARTSCAASGGFVWRRDLALGLAALVVIGVGGLGVT